MLTKFKTNIRRSQNNFDQVIRAIVFLPQTPEAFVLELEVLEVDGGEVGLHVAEFGAVWILVALVGFLFALRKESAKKKKSMRVMNKGNNVL